MENRKIFFSIVIPVFNTEKYLKKCLESVIAQTFRSFEIILIDDGSTDSSVFICDSYVKKYEFIDVLHKSNEGLSAARNDGIHMAQGKYIIFLDSDDWMEDIHSFEKLQKFIVKNGYPPVIINLIQKCEDGTEAIENSKYLFDETKQYSTPILMFYDLIRIKGIFLGAQVFVMAKDELMKKELFFESGIYHEDILWITQVFLRQKKIQLNNLELFCYRTSREGSIINTVNNKKIDDLMFILERLEEECKNCTLSKKEIHVMQVWMSKIYNSICFQLAKKQYDIERFYNRLNEKLYLLKMGDIKEKVVYVFAKIMGIKSYLFLYNLLGKS